MLTYEQIEAELRLFKSYTLDNNENYEGLFSKDNYNKGILFLEEPPLQVKEQAIDMYGKDAVKWNQTFHKSFATVRDTDIETLIAQQIIHYFTTYGLEALNLYNQDLVYIPHEQLEIVDLKEDIPLVIIHKISFEELGNRIMKLLTSGIALSKQTISDIMSLSDYIDKTRFDEIQNREIKTALYDKYQIAPKNNIEFLRYIVYKLTGSTLLIKNQAMIQSIKKADIGLVIGYINNYIKDPTKYIELSEIFLRYKDIFLAFKRKPEESSYSKAINKIINRLDKLSRVYGHHKKAPKFILDYLTELSTKMEEEVYKDQIFKELGSCTVFREIRLLNAIGYRLDTNTDDIVFKIRNGKGYATKFNKDMSEEKRNTQLRLYNLVRTHLIKRLNNKLANKTIYLPNDIVYTLPSSEKQFCGNIPQGSYIEVKRDNDMVLGIHWTNLPDERVDLDLHAQNKSEQYGWNSSYRSNNSDFYFSGDVTDAPEPNGATELYYVGKNCGDKAFLLTLNDYTMNNNEDVKFEFVIAKSNTNIIEKNYVIDPNNIITTVPMIFDHAEGTIRQMTLGFIKITSDYIRFYFDDFALGSSIVTKQNSTTISTYNYLENTIDTQIKLGNLLQYCEDVKIVMQPFTEKLIEVGIDEQGDTLYKKETKPVDYDLSVDKITKETIIAMLTEE